MPAGKIFLFYPVWVLISVFCSLMVRYLPEGGGAYALIVGMLLLISAATRWHLVRVEPALGERPRVRQVLLLALLVVFLIGYLLAAVAGVEGNLLSAFRTANLILLACVLGSWLSTALKRPAEIVPVCCILAAVDAFSVFSGPTRYLTGALTRYYEEGMAGAPPLVDFILVKMPLPGHGALMPVFGISDWVAVVLLSAAARRFHMNDNLLAKTGSRFLFFPLAALGLLLSIVAARETGIYLPALPMIAGIFLAVMLVKYPETRRLTRNELMPMAIILAALAALIVIVKATAGPVV